MKFLLAIFLLIYTFSLAFTQAIKFTHYSTNDGLSQGTVKAILQDKNGFIWIGTDDGLNKFNGYEFNVFHNNPSDSTTISNNDINAIIQDKEGIVWIGTNWGLNSYNPITSKFTQFLQNPSKEHQLSDNVIQTILEDEYGIIWLGTENGGLVGYDKNINKFTVYKNNPKESASIPSNKVNCLIKARDGNIWIGTNEGLVKFKKLSGIFVTYKQSTDLDTTWNKSKNIITSIFEDDNGIFWIGTDKAGISTFDPKTETFVDYGIKITDNNKINRIRGIVEDNNKKIWIATSHGLSFYDEKSNSFNKYITNDPKDIYSLTHNDLYSIYKDNTGSIWIGTYGNGLNVFHPNRIKFQHYRKNEYSENEFESNLIHGFAEDKYGNLLIGTNGGGLMSFNRKNNTFSMLNKKVPEIYKSILTVHVDKDNIAWLGTWGNGLQKLDLNTMKIKTYDTKNSGISGNTILCIYEENGILWLGTYSGGLIRFDKTTEEVKIFNTRNGLGSDKVFCISGNNTDTLWIGTRYGGFNIFNKKTENAITFMLNKKNSASISSNTVISLYNNNGEVWLATESGLNKFIKSTGEFKKYYRADGLPNDHIYSVQPDDYGNIWLSSNKGITRFNPNSKQILFKNFDVNDGLQGNEFNQCSYYKSRTGELFFGGTNGFNSFNPALLNEFKYIPKTYIYSMKIFDNEYIADSAVYLKNEIILNYKENFISFEFVGLDFIFPLKNQYSYMLEGLDNDWSSPSNRRYASYPNLQPGVYTFKVKSMNNDDTWSANPASIRIIIEPPFWRTTSFIIFSSLFIILLVIILIRLRIMQIKKENKVLEDKVKLRTHELIQKNNDITSSIKYAKRIQEAILPSHKRLKKYFSESFMLYKPKDIVSGDFLWATQIENTKIIAVVDCTGHGVPGAFMSIISNNFLKQIIIDKQITNPGKILSELHTKIMTTLHQQNENDDSADGMDIAICTITDDLLEFSGANRPIYILSNRFLNTLRGNKLSIGGNDNILDKKFDTIRFKIKKGDNIYMFTDGFADQFGGNEGKKYMVKNFQNLLNNISTKNHQEQFEILDNEFSSWKKDYEQVDDVLVIGFKI